MAEITKSEAQAPTSTNKYVNIMLGVLAVFTYFFGLTIPFLGPDESRYAQVGREMFERGDWLTPTLGGFNWFEKPALLYWLEIASYHVFGVNEFAARFGPAIFGLGIVASLYVLGKKIVATNHEEQITNDLPTTLALVSASSLGILAFAHGASFDIIITFPMTASLVSFYVWHAKNETGEGSDRVSISLILFYVFIGIALLAKGLIGAVFPIAIVVFYYLLSRKLPSRTFVLSLFWGGTLAVAVASVWYLPMYMRHGYEFIDEFFIQHHFQRFTSNKYQHPQPFYFFLIVLPLMTLPWMPFVISSIWKSVRDSVRRVSASPRPGVRSPNLRLFSLSWLLIPLVFFSFSGSKLPGYILPAVPAAVVFAALYLNQLASQKFKWNTITRLVALCVFIGIVVIQLTVMPWFAPTDSVKTLVAATNSRGFTTDRILAFYSIDHNAEFYAAGRLIRDETGKQRAFYSVEEVAAFVATEPSKRVLVFVKLVDMGKLNIGGRLSVETLADNTEYAVALVRAN